MLKKARLGQRALEERILKFIPCFISLIAIISYILDLTIRGDLERLRRNRYSFLRLNKRMGLLAIRSNKII